MSLLFSRLLALFFSAATGAGVLVLSGMAAHPVWGAMAGAALWLAWDAWSILKLSGWLRQLHDAPERLSLPEGFHGIWRETAERVYRLLRQQHRLIQQNEHRLENLLSALQASPDGLVMLDRKTGIVWCNQTACRHFNLEARRDIAQPITHLLRHPEFIAYLAAKDFGQSITLSGPSHTPSHPLRLSIQIYPYGQGQMLMLSRDITVLEQAEAMRRDFIANVSHEIKTPLTVLTGLVETLQSLPLEEEEQKRYLEWMAQQAARMQDLVHDLLNLSRLEDSPPPDPETSTSVRGLIRECETEILAFSELLDAEGGLPHRLTFPSQEALAEAGEIIGDPGELRSVLTNLVHNALRHTPAGSAVEIRWTPLANGGAVLSVRDDGPGIAPEHIARLTERFYRVDPGRSEKSGGTGLGLSIVKHVLLRHDARLHIDSVPGQGSCFSAIFPESRIRRSSVVE